jgi:drug/metabolite transporter (DMT)-like permease
MLPRVPRSRLVLMTVLALSGFAANSLLCRLALRGSPAAIDAGTFTLVRLLAGVVTLVLIAGPRAAWSSGSWASGAALGAYAIAFSFAYLALGAGVGAFIVFGSVQVTMVGWGVARGDLPSARQWLGMAIAMAGLAILTLPGMEAPPWRAALAMAVAGAGWGVYSLRGRGATRPIAATAGNFLRALPLVLLPSLALRAAAADTSASAYGIALAIASGAVASGLAYACWYAALPGLTATRAAVLMLTVPVLTAIAAIVLLGEPPSARLLGGGVAIVVGLALTIARRRPPAVTAKA